MDFFKDKSPFENGDQLEVNVELAEPGKGGAVCFLQGKPADGEGERVRIEPDLIHGDLSMRQVRQALEHLRLDHRRHDQEAGHGVKQQEGGDNCKPPAGPGRQGRKK